MARKQSRLTESDLKNILSNNASLKIKEERKKKTIATLKEMKGDLTEEPKKRKGTDVNQIISTLKDSIITTSTSNKKDEEKICIWFTGARVLTLNQIFAILENRKYEIFKYKKVWQECINTAILTIPAHERPYFNKATRLTLFRRGTRLVDLDSFQTVFKYCIDGLRYAGILSEDNPEIIVETIPIQQKGPTSVGIMLETIPDWKKKNDVNIYKEWFNKDEPLKEK